MQVDNDGDPDLYLGGEETSAVWVNDGDGNFVLKQEISPPAPRGESANYQDSLCGAWADMDGDGDIDLVPPPSAPCSALARPVRALTQPHVCTHVVYLQGLGHLRR